MTLANWSVRGFAPAASGNSGLATSKRHASLARSSRVVRPVQPSTMLKLTHHDDACHAELLRRAVDPRGARRPGICWKPRRISNSVASSLACFLMNFLDLVNTVAGSRPYVRARQFPSCGGVRADIWRSRCTG